MYPEYAETDFIEEFCDDQIFEDHLVSFFVILFKWYDSYQGFFVLITTNQPNEHFALLKPNPITVWIAVVIHNFNFTIGLIIKLNCFSGGHVRFDELNSEYLRTLEQA